MPAVAEANAAQAKPQEAASSEDIRKDINGALHLSEQEKVIPGNSALSAFLLGFRHGHGGPAHPSKCAFRPILMMQMHFDT